MTIVTTTNKVEYDGNDVATTFDFDFKLLVSSSELKVYLVSTTGVTTLLTLTTDYTVTVASYPGNGSITYPVSGSPLATGERIILQRVEPLTQRVSLENQGGYYPKVLEINIADKHMCILQQHQEEIDRSFKIGIGSTQSNDADAYLATITADLAAAVSAKNAAVLAQTCAETAETNAETAEALAEEWASKVDGIVDATEYSSKAHAIGGTGVDGVSGSSKAWAITAEDTEVISGQYSAYHWAKKAEDYVGGNVILKNYGETVNIIGSIGGGSQDIDLTLGNVVSATVDTSETTLAFTNIKATGTACGFVLYLTNGGSQTVNFPASVDWAGGSAPTLTASGVDILVFSTIDGGTIWHGMLSSGDSK